MPSASTTSVSVRRASSNRRDSPPRSGPGGTPPGRRWRRPRPDTPGPPVLEPRGLGGAARQAQVGVDHLHLGSGPAQPDRLVGQRILAGGRLGVVPDLGHDGLADVDQRRSAPGGTAVIFSAPLTVGLQRRGRHVGHHRHRLGRPASLSRARPRANSSTLMAEISSSAARTCVEIAAPGAPRRPPPPARTPCGCGPPPGAAPHRCRARAVRPLAHRHPSLPHVDPVRPPTPQISPSTSGSERASAGGGPATAGWSSKQDRVLSVIAIQDHDRPPSRKSWMVATRRPARPARARPSAAKPVANSGRGPIGPADRQRHPPGRTALAHQHPLGPGGAARR